MNFQTAREYAFWLEGNGITADTPCVLPNTVRFVDADGDVLRAYHNGTEWLIVRDDGNIAWHAVVVENLPDYGPYAFDHDGSEGVTDPLYKLDIIARDRGLVEESRVATVIDEELRLDELQEAEEAEDRYLAERAMAAKKAQGDRPYKSLEQLSHYAGGGRRSSDEYKPRFEHLLVTGLSYEDQPLTRAALRMSDGAKRYGGRNFEQFTDREALERCYGSLLRHVMQLGEEVFHGTRVDGEDHLAGVICNAVMLGSVIYNVNEAENNE